MATNSRMFISRFQEALRDIIRQLTNADLDEEKVDGIIFRLDQLSVHLVRLCSTDLMSNEIEQLITNTIILLRSYSDNFNNQVSFQSERSLNGNRGRPSYNISSEQLQYLLDYDLSDKVCSRMTKCIAEGQSV